MAALAGKIALVTGASRGIGAETAKALAAAGAHVILVARNAAALESVEEAIHAAGGSATIAPLDLTDTDAVARLAAAVAGRWTSLDVLVLNAAMLGTLSPVTAVDPNEIARLFTLNVLAQQALLAAFTPMLRNAAAPRVIALSSSVARTPRAYWGAYGASKAALENLLLSYAEEMRNISSICVALLDPGATRTQMRASAFPGEDSASVKAPDVVAEAILRLATDAMPSPHFEALGR